MVQQVVQQVRLMMFSLNMVDHSMSFLLLSTWIYLDFYGQVEVLFEVFLWDPSFILELYWMVVVGGGLQHFSVIPSPLGTN